MPDDSDVMTMSEVMAYLHKSRQTVYNLVKRGKLKKHVSPIGAAHGQRLYFLRSEVEALAAGVPELARKESRK